MAQDRAIRTMTHR